MKQETIADIVLEMREHNPTEEYPAEYGYGEVPNAMRQLADRIEAAYNRELCDRYAEVVDDREREILKLRKALTDAATGYCHLCHKLGCPHDDPDNNRPCAEFREWKRMAMGGES